MIERLSLKKSHADVANQGVKSMPGMSSPSLRLAEVEKSAQRDLELLFLDPEPDAELHNYSYEVEREEEVPDLPERPLPKLPPRPVPIITFSSQNQDRRPPPKPMTKPDILRSKTAIGSTQSSTKVGDRQTISLSRPRPANKPSILRSVPVRDATEDAHVSVNFDEAQGVVSITSVSASRSNLATSSEKPQEHVQPDAKRPTVSKALTEPWGKFTTKAKLGVDQVSVVAQSSTQLMRKKSADISAAIGTATKPGAVGIQKGAAEASEKLKPVGKAVGKTMYNTVGRPVEQMAKAMANDFSDTIVKIPFKHNYLCSQCRKFPSSQLLTSAPLQGRRIWVSPLRRLIWHGTGCRFCTFLLRALSSSPNDPFDHPQMRPYLKGPLAKQTFASWMSENDASILLNSLWPFGDGERIKGLSDKGEDGGATRLFGSIGASTINAGMDLTEILLNLLIQGGGIKRRVGGKQVSIAPKSNVAKSIHLKEPLPCFIQICTSKYGRGVLDVSLMGFGPSVRTLAPLSNFRLRLETSSGPIKQLDLGLDQNAVSYGRHVRWGQIDVELSRWWLHHCERVHGSMCHEPAWARIKEKPSFLRVIDVYELRLVDFQGDHVQQLRYIALSYVWGPTNNVTLERSKKERWLQPRGLEQESVVLPKTISDAITVTKATGERYLWVDSLCICQDDINEKLEQIEMMDRVYGNALVTIIAADSSHANMGLHGVRQSTRELQHLTENITDDTKIMLPLQNPQKLATSPWNARAWTMQERFLSRRLLIFIEGQMIWRCRKAVNYEDMPGEEKGLPSEDMTWFTIKPQYLGINVRRGYVDGSLIRTPDGRTEIVRSGTFTEYSQLIREYTHRQMTQPGDILRALAGLLHIFELSFKSVIFQGLPQTLLDAAILWRPTKTLQRRIVSDEKVPSWSWAGWIGRVEFEQTYSDDLDEKGFLTRKSQVTAGPERFRPLLRWYTYNAQERKLLPINGHGLGIPWQGNVEETLPEEWEKTPFFVSTTPIRLYEMPVETRNLLDKHHLIFRTSCTSHLILGDQILGNPRSYRLVDSNYKNVGSITLTGSGPEWIDESRHEFLVLSEAQYFGHGPERGRAPEDYSGEYPLYNIMLVEWDQEWRITTRLGVGRVFKTAWIAAHPAAKVVVLG